MANRNNPITKYFLIGCGLILVGIGIVGILVPGLPTTIFLIGAAACFAKSSPCLHAWLLSHPWFGDVLSDWQTHRSIPRRAKRIALSMMVLACIYSSLVIESTTIIGVVLVCMVFPFYYVAQLPLSELVQVKTEEEQELS